MANNQVSLKIGIVNPADWLDHDENTPLPLQQHPTYGRALETFGATAKQATFSSGATVVGHALLIERRFFGLISFTTIFRGPVWRDPATPDEVKSAAYTALKKLSSPWRWNFICVMPEQPHSDSMQPFMQKAGYRRVMSGFSTCWLDLRPEPKGIRAALKGKWRNQLVKAESSGLDISFGGRKAHQYTWLLEKEAEQRSKRRYQATPLGLVPAFVRAATPKSASGVMAVTALKDKRKIAGALFLIHGNSATYHIGWAGDDARKLNAQNQILWEGIGALKKQGVRFLDLGGLNTADLAGIARFKLGMGGTPLTLAGAYV